MKIDGRWSAKDFADFYSSIDALYSLFALVEIEEQSAYEVDRFYRNLVDFPAVGRRSPQRSRYFFRLQRSLAGLGHVPIEPTLFSDASRLLERDERLVVRRCEYASPGVTDFSGIGQALGHVKDVVLKCIDVWTGRRERGLKNDILEQQREGEALKNIRERISILKELGYTDTHCRQILAEVSPAVAKLEALAHRGLIGDASNDEDDG